MTDPADDRAWLLSDYFEHKAHMGRDVGTRLGEVLAERLRGRPDCQAKLSEVLTALEGGVVDSAGVGELLLAVLEPKT